MLNQKVSVDVWAMFQSMLGYLALAILGGIFIRLIVAAFTLPGRLRQQKDKIQQSLDELKLKYPEAFKNIEEELSKQDGDINGDDKENSKSENTSTLNVVDKKIN